jgi:NAD(P)-dependent dehydrogenase (short-subunit alcohol dehydrogenase family)
MDLELDGKVAVVTGASKGIDLAIVRTLASEGMHVVGGALTVDSLEGIERVTPVAVDLVDPAGSTSLVRKALEQHGRVDVLVNNVGGVQLRLTGFLEITDNDFERSMQLNFFAALRATRAAVAAMVDQGGSVIVTSPPPIPSSTPTGS